MNSSTRPTMHAPSRRLFAVGSLAALAGVERGWAAGRASVRLGVVNVPFHAVVGAAVAAELRDGGLDVERRTGDHAELFAALRVGEIDLLAVAWLPHAHGHLAGDLTGLSVAGVAYRDARLFWAVPERVPDTAAASIADLAKPEVVRRMERTITSIGPSAGLSVRSAQAMTAYGLDAAGYALQTADAAAWAATIEALAKSDVWFVAPLWRPHHLASQSRLRPLADPLGVFGGPDEGVILARSAWLDEASPAVRERLANFYIGLEDVEHMDLTAASGASPDDAARDWRSAWRQRLDNAAED